MLEDGVEVYLVGSCLIFLIFYNNFFHNLNPVLCIIGRVFSYTDIMKEIKFKDLWNLKNINM